MFWLRKELNTQFGLRSWGLHLWSAFCREAPLRDSLAPGHGGYGSGGLLGLMQGLGPRRELSSRFRG